LLYWYAEARCGGWGAQVVKAFVVLTSDYVNQDQQQLIEQLQAHVRDTTAPYKYPRKVSIQLRRLISRLA